jgi:hypothetical protein
MLTFSTFRFPVDPADSSMEDMLSVYRMKASRHSMFSVFEVLPGPEVADSSEILVLYQQKRQASACSVERS